MAKSIKAGLVVTGPSLEEVWTFSKLFAVLINPRRADHLVTHVEMKEIIFNWGMCQSSPLGAELRRANELTESIGTPIPSELMVRVLRAWCADLGSINREVLLLIGAPACVDSVVTEFCHKMTTIDVDFSRQPLGKALRETLNHMERYNGPVNHDLVTTGLNRLNNPNHPIHTAIGEVEKLLIATPAQSQPAAVAA